MKLLLELLPRYCEHVEKHPHTLLIKFYGLHRVRPLKGAKVGCWPSSLPPQALCLTAPFPHDDPNRDWVHVSCVSALCLHPS